MSVHVEWLGAHDTCAEIIAPGEDWVAAEHQNADKFVLALSTDEVVAIEGTLPQLRALAARITAVIAGAETRFKAAG